MKSSARNANQHRLELMSGIMSGEAARSLDLLRAIDGTIEALVYARRNMEALSETCDSLIDRAGSESLDGEPLEVEVIPSLVEVLNYSRTSREVMTVKWRIALAAPELDSDDAVVEAYEQVITASDGLISRVSRLIEKISEKVALSQATPLQRKLARNRSPLLSQETLDSAAKSNAAFLIQLGKKSRIE